MIHEPASVWALEQAAPVRPQVYRILRQRIIAGDFAPGVRISESEIALSCSVSRQPVREAFIKLAEEGLVEVRPQRGTYVSKISNSAVMDARFVREAIESDVVKLLAEMKDPALISELRDQLVKQRDAMDLDPGVFMELDEKFHQTLAEGAGKAYAWHVLEGLKSQMDRVRHLSARQFPVAKLFDQHTAIVDAIALGNVVAAEQALRLHLREILSDLPAIVAGMPEHFNE